MKIKCVENRNGSECYLTVGKVYDAEVYKNSSYPRVIVCITDDTGEVLYIYLKASGHGKFEVVEE